MTRSPLAAQTNLVVVNRPVRPEADRVVLTADRGKFWLAGDSHLWAEQDHPVLGRAEITFWPGHLKGELTGWQADSTAILNLRGQSMVAGWLDWLNRRLEVTPVSLEADSSLESSRFWQVLSGAWSLLRARRAPELAGAYFYLRVF